MSFSAETIRQITSKLGVPEDATWPDILAALDARLEELANPAPVAALPAVAPAPDTVLWGLATGRYSEPRAAFWDRHRDAERARTGSTVQTDAEIQSLAPVYEPPVTAVRDPSTGQFIVASASGRSPSSPDDEFPLTRELDRAMFGPTTEERRHSEDLAAERGLAAQIEREREQAAGGDEAARELFGD